MLDDLRNSVNEAYDEEVANKERLEEQRKNRKPFLGMTPVQRFIVSLALFLLIAIIGTIILILYQKMLPPI